MTQQIQPTPPAGPQYAPPPQYGLPVYGPPPGGYAPAPAPRRRRTGLVVGAIVAGVLLLGGLVVGALLLFGTKTLESADVEREITRITAEQAGVAPTEVSCPGGIEAEASATFSCTASLEDQPVSFTVRQTDDEGNVRVESDNTFVHVDVVEASLDQQLGDLSGVVVITSCDTGGRSVLVDAVGVPIPCFVDNAADATDTIQVEAFVDEAGDVSYQVE
jgi:hypothetical protein